ncbi:MAG: hypothetical protein ACRD2N_21025 [Vicinamibacterales bacterium]
MTTLIKLVVAALILNAAARAGLAAFDHYRFTDAAKEAMVFAPNATDAQLVQSVARIARTHDVPITEDDITLRHDGPDIIVEFSYAKDVNLVPSLYTKRWSFSPSISVRSLRLVPAPRP